MPFRTLWPLTGRDHELQAFDSAWDAPHVRAVVIWGPAGVGKTRLAEEFLGRAAQAGSTIVRATATAAAAAVPLGAVAHLIPPGADMADPVSGFAQVAAAVAGTRPEPGTVVLIDDLHHLDAASAVLVRQLMDAGLIRLIATVRTGEPVSDAVAALAGGDAAARVDLEGLHAPQVDALLQAALGAPVARSAAARLSAMSGGNPLYLRELVLGAIMDGSLASDGEIWQLAEPRVPGTPKLTELIEARLAAAPPAARPVLELLALCEPLGFSDTAPLADDDLLGGLEQAGLIAVETNGARTEIRLAHPLYADVILAEIPRVRRRRLLLDQVERTLSGPHGRADDARRVAIWQLAATGSADPVQLVQAATLARYAHDNQQALALLEALPDDAQTVDTRLMLADIMLELGDTARAESLMATAEALATTERDALAVLEARMYALMLWSLSPAEDITELTAHARAQVTSPDGLVALRHVEGGMRILSGDVLGGLALLEDLPEHAEDAPDKAAWLGAASGKLLALALIGRAEEAMVLAGGVGAAIPTAQDAFARSGEASGSVLLSIVLCGQGRLSEARELGEQGYATAAEAAMSVPLTWSSINLAMIEWLAGHPVGARRYYAEATALVRRIGNVRLMRPTLSGLAACAALLGDLDAAEKAVAESAGYAPSGFTVTWESLGPAWLAAARGNLAEARKTLAAAADEARAVGLFGAEAIALLDIARLGAASEVTARLDELVERCEGQLVTAQAHFAAALAADDPDRLLTCAEEFQGIGADLLAAEAATAAATTFRGAGQNRKAAAADRLADSCAARCEGARTPLLVKARSAATLTARQRDIALMAANGVASRDIAEALHVSVRTVDSHLYTVYAKLGVTTRRELAEALGVEDHQAHSTPSTK